MNAEYELWTARDANEEELAVMAEADAIEERYNTGLLTSAEIKALPFSWRVSELEANEFVKWAFYGFPG